MRIYYLITPAGLVKMPDSAALGLEKAPVKSGWVVLTPAMEAALENINRIKR